METEADKHFHQADIDDFYQHEEVSKNNIVIFNFTTRHLKQEYKRLQKANIDEMSEIMYVNIYQPYWYFDITVPDGNLLEITGDYS